jgi:predicted transcriptional regulator of viral defense system
VPIISYICNKKIIADSLKIERLKKYFSQVDYFSTADLFRFYSIGNWELTKNTLNWRIYKLVKMGVLQRVGRGLYTLGKEIIFYPKITNPVKKLHERINNDFPFANFCIWHTSSLNKFMRHQPARFQFILDVEKDVSESVFYFVKELYPNVFLNPNEEIYT